MTDLCIIYAEIPFGGPSTILQVHSQLHLISDIPTSSWLQDMTELFPVRNHSDAFDKYLLMIRSF